jgi:type VI secretion system protein ImpJ
MAVHAVHWHEGMFLLPQHLQAAQRHGFHLAQLSDRWSLHYQWGLRDIELDEDALANFRVVVRALKARLRDGTLVSIPEDGNLPVLDLKNAFSDKVKSIRIYLAVPALQVGRPNAAAGSSDGMRYLVETQEVEDENSGQNPRAVHFRRLNLRLLLSTQDLGGYETLPIAQVTRSDRAEATPELDVAYFPPVLACDAWKALAAGVLEKIYDRIGKILEQQAAQVVSRGISLESHAQGDRLIIERLRALNEADALLSVLVFVQGLHPLPAYLELCRLVGQFAVFSKQVGPRTPRLPQYDHDDLGGCFYRVKNYLDTILDDMGPAEYQERPFIGTGLQMEVKLEPAWLEMTWQMFVGVLTTLTPEQCVRMLSPGGLDMKIASAAQADRIFTRRQAGLKFTHTPNPPRVLPASPGLVYFQVDPHSQPEVWDAVKSELTLALRLNEKRIAGNIRGERILKIATGGGQTATLQFTLYIVPRGK